MISSIDIKAGGSTWTIRLSTAAMVRLEREHGKPIHEIMAAMESGVGVSTLVSMFAAMLHDGAGGTEEEAMEMLDKIGGPFKAVEHLTEAVRVAFPDADGDEEASGGGGRGKKRSAARSR